MQIELSKAEYRTLLAVLEMADWIPFAHCSDRPSDREDYHDFEQQIFGYAETFGFGNMTGSTRSTSPHWNMMKTALSTR